MDISSSSDIDSIANSLTRIFGDSSWMVPIILGIIGLLIVALYIYMSWALLSISTKLGHKKPWMAWTPIVNFYLTWELSKTPRWTMIAFFIGLFTTGIPVIGGLISLGISAIYVYWFWTICEQLGKPKWWSIFIYLFLPVWLVMLGILAWGNTTSSKTPIASTTPVIPTS